MIQDFKLFDAQLHIRSITLLALALVFSITACDRPGPGEVMSSVDIWGVELDLRIGSVQGEDALTWFRSLQVGEAGTMFTLHPMEQAVRVFDVDGSILRMIGGRGDGPGKFQNVFTMGWVADTLWVLDGNGYRFNMFTEDGDYLGSFSVPFAIGEDPAAAQPPRPLGLLGDGTVHGSPPAFSHQIQDGTLTEHLPMLMTRDGVVTDTLPAIPFGRNQWAISDPDDPRRGGLYMQQPFADGPLWSFVPGERATLRLDRDAPGQVQGATFTLTKISFAGDTLFSRNYPFDVIPVSQTKVDSILAATESMILERGFLGVTAGQARDWVEDGFYQPDFRSPIGQMVIGRDGTIWLSETGNDVKTATWLVLDSSGETIARVGLPSGFKLYVADRTHAWGSETDELDVPYLARYRIVQPG